MNKEIEKVIKSVGFNIESDGMVLDNSKGTTEFAEEFQEGEEVDFAEGMKDLKDYVFAGGGEVRDDCIEEYWEEMEALLMKLHETVGNAGTWRLWGVEYDWNLGVEI